MTSACLALPGPGPIRRTLQRWAWAWAWLPLLLAACGGDGGGGVVGASGGRVEGVSGASVTVPAGALATDTPIAISASTDGAPPLPAGSVPAGRIFALTPHGTVFRVPVTVRLPVEPAADGWRPRLYKTQAGGSWEPVPGAVVEGGFVTAQVESFSWFAFLAIPPTITRQPAAVTVQAPAAAAFEVVAIGSPPFGYRWQRSTDGLAWDDIPGADRSGYSLPVTARSDDGLRFRVVVSNPDGPSTSTAALLTVTAAAALITVQPADVSAAPGDDVVFNVTATGSGLAYQWERSTDGGTSWTPLPGETNASLVLAAVQPADSGSRWRVQVSGSTSREALLTVTAPPPPAATGGVVAAGRGHTLVRRADGSLLAWGADGNGELGDGEPRSDRASPGAVALTGAIGVAAAGRKGAAIDASGAGWAWGSNGFGELGIGALDDRSSPAPLDGNRRYRAVSVGSEHVLWLRTDGILEAAGFNGVGALGQPATVYLSMTPLALSTVVSWTQVAAGNNFSLAVRFDGAVFTWGTNTSGQFGRAPDTFNVPGQLHQILYLPDHPRAIAAGHRHALAIDAAGRLWSWGESRNGKLGHGAPAQAWGVPQRLPLPGTFVAIAAGEEHSLALRDDGVVFAWGLDETGQLGQGRALGMSAVPLQVPGLTRIRAIAAGGGLGHSVAVAEDGSVWTWGRNDQGQLGRNGRVDSATPAPVPALNLN